MRTFIFATACPPICGLGGIAAEARLADARSALGTVDVVAADIGSEADVTRVFDAVDHVDHLVISAGALGNGAVVASDITTIRSIVDERVCGAIHAVRAAVPKMTGGSITLTSAGTSSGPPVGAAMYTATLAAVEALAPRSHRFESTA